MRISVLGPLEVTGGDDSPLSIGGPKPKALLTALVARPNVVLPVDTIVDVLWGEQAPLSARTTVRAYMSRMRGVLGTAALPSRSSGYLLRVGPDDLDAAVFESLVERGRSEVAELRLGAAVETFTQALGLWRGQPFQQRGFDPVADAEARRLYSLRDMVIEERINTLIDLERHGDAIPELEAALVDTPLREELWRLLMLALYRSGRQADALRAYRRAAEHLGEEAGLVPGPALQELEGLILEQSPTLDPVTVRYGTPTASVDAPQHGLIGREDDLTALREALITERVVTLTGPGGVGKTSLAHVAVKTLENQVDGPVRVVELANIKDATNLIAMLSAELGVNTETSATPEESLNTWMCQQTGVILVDNCEHVIEDIALLIEKWARSTGVTFLATSREPLGIDGEHLQPVATLDAPSESEMDDPDSILASQAVRLFTQRAAAARPGYEPTDAELVAIGEVCRQLDGLPLAIELAAARIAIMTAREIEERLTKRFAVLSTRRLPLPDRQRTLEAAIRWSYNLLDDEDRRVLEALGVFEGTFDLAAIEATLSGSTETFDAIDGLVAKNLLVAEHGERTRYRLLESIRAFARSVMTERTDQQEAQRNHAHHYGWLIHGIWKDHGELDPLGAHQLIQPELPNLRAAIEWLIANEPDEAVSVLADLGRYWRDSNLIDDGIRLTEAALSAPNGQDTPARGSAANSLAAFYVRRGDIQRGVNWLNESLRLALQSGDLLTAARAHNNLAVVRMTQGALDTAAEHYEQARSLYTETGFEAGLLTVLGNLGNLAYEQGDADEAGDYHRLHLEESRKQGNKREEIRALVNLSVTHFELSDLPAAEAWVNEAIAAVTPGEMDDLLAPALQTRAELFLSQGQWDQARTWADKAIRLALDIRWSTVLDALMTFAEIAAEEAEYEKCAYLFGAAMEHRARVPRAVPLAAEQRHTRLARARQVLGEQFDAISADGARTDKQMIRMMAKGGLSDWSRPSG